MIVSKEREEHQQWLNGLKVGDEVAIDYGRYGYRITKIEKITPTRRFVIQRGGSTYTFDNSGMERGSKSASICPVTKKIKDQIARVKAITFLKQMDWEHISSESLLDIVKIINKELK